MDTIKSKTKKRIKCYIKQTYWLLYVILFLTTRIKEVQGWHIVTSFRASTKSILTSAPITFTKEKVILATAGHEKGMLHLWTLPSSLTTSIAATTTAAVPERTSFQIHNGSIFSLHAITSKTKEEECYILSGSFDRSASLHHLSIKDANDYKLEHVGTLPDHTGWVRHVEILSIHQKKMILSSIGCNYINLWTPTTPLSSSTATMANTQMTAKRITRCDGGPSPNDDVTQKEFRRHDILTMCTLSSTTQQHQQQHATRLTVAGLVDGSLRIFQTFNTMDNIDDDDDEESKENDYTGNCAPVPNRDDVTPIVSIMAHDGRIVGIHQVQSSPPRNKDNNDDDNDKNTFEFITVGYEGDWKWWRFSIYSSIIITNETNNAVTQECIAPPSPLSSSNVEITNLSSGTILHHDNLTNNDNDNDTNVVVGGGDNTNVNKQFNRISSSILLPSSSSLSFEKSSSSSCQLFLGTTLGDLYCVTLPTQIIKNANPTSFTCDRIWKEEEEIDCAIASLSYYHVCSSDGDDDDKNKSNVVIVVGTSNGMIRLLQQKDTNEF